MASKVEQHTAPTPGPRAAREVCKNSSTAACSPVSNSEEPKQQLSIKLQPPDTSPYDSSLDDHADISVSLLSSGIHRRRGATSTISSAPRGTPSSTRSAPTPQLGRGCTTRGIFGSLSSVYSRSAEGKKSDSSPMLAEPVVGSLLMPDGVTIRRPPKLGISSGDPVGTHILRRRAACSGAEPASPSGPFASRLNLSLHRLSVNTSWQRTFRSAAWTSGGRRRGPMSRHLNPTADSLPKIVAFSPSLNRALFQDTCLVAPLRSASSSALFSPQIATSVSEPPPYIPETLSSDLQQSPDSSLLKPVDGIASSPGSSCKASPRLQVAESPLPCLTRLPVSDHASGVDEDEENCAVSVSPESFEDSVCQGSQRKGRARASPRGASPSSHAVGSSLLVPSSPAAVKEGERGEGFQDQSLLAQDEIFREAKKCEDELAANPKNEEAVYRLGVLKFRAGQIEDAISLVSAFLQKHAPKRSKAERRSEDAARDSKLSLDHQSGGGEQALADNPLAGHKQQTQTAQADGTSKSRREDVASIGEGGTAREGGEVNEDNQAKLSKEDECTENGKETDSAEAGATISKDAPSTQSRQPDEGDCFNAEGNPKEEQLDWRVGKAAPIQKLFNVILDRRSQVNRRAKDILEDWGPPVYLQLEKLLGHLWFEAENFPEAVRHYWRCIDICPDDAQLFTNLGLAYYEMEAMKEATAAFEQAIKLNDRDATSLSVLAMLLMDEFAEAEEGRLRAIEESSEEPLLPSEEERLRGLREGTERCVAMLQKCLEIDENNILAKLHLSQVYVYREEWDRSEEILQALLEENPDDTHILNNLGQVALNKGDNEKAFQFLERVLNINPEDELAHMHLCELLCKTNQPARALEHFKLCCESSPDSVSLHATCGLPLCEVGKEKEVIAAYTEFIKAHPESAAAKTFKRSLGSMGEDVGFMESTSIIVFIVLPILLLLMVLLGCAHFFASLASPAPSIHPFADPSHHSEL
ncbi:tetratricopeptide repeat-containing protein [Toxoplasma gondii MAS]|uniref:Tetratricopeptide repeat-containing protein n=2 Tax=Toxoplasma gondii TaxID=5811 RepID=A0A086QIK3_TOXGO|nr:tetratricopeptide repeat-containing protein [Toxoplasma gondii MAS]PUA85118.1 tetratricopeptide repeat-containing protein [Toxoplasma gondii TgCATBr9]